jgi:uncharacterized DUF497 family protein
MGWNLHGMKGRISAIRRNMPFRLKKRKTVFYDEFARLIHDPEHSEDEDRFILLGFSNQIRMLVVCHCYREDEQVIRIISARKATKSEQKMYEGFRDER